MEVEKVPSPRGARKHRILSRRVVHARRVSDDILIDCFSRRVEKSSLFASATERRDSSSLRSNARAREPNARSDSSSFFSSSSRPNRCSKERRGRGRGGNPDETETKNLRKRRRDAKAKNESEERREDQKSTKNILRRAEKRGNVERVPVSSRSR